MSASKGKPVNILAHTVPQRRRRRTWRRQDGLWEEMSFLANGAGLRKRVERRGRGSPEEHESILVSGVAECRVKSQGRRLRWRCAVLRTAAGPRGEEPLVVEESR